MNRKEILLIPVQDNLSHIGLKYLHYILLDGGFQSKLLYLPYLDLNDSHRRNNLREFISQLNPLYIGLSLTSFEYNRARDLSIFLKKNFPLIPIIWGGVHTSIELDFGHIQRFVTNEPFVNCFSLTMGVGCNRGHGAGGCFTRRLSSCTP